MPSATLLLLPEDAPSIASMESVRPVYARVVRRDADQVTVRPVGLLSAADITIPSATAQQRQVPATEIRSGAPGTMLRQPVVAEVNGIYLYGQVVDYSSTMFTVRTHQEDIDVPHGFVSEVAPVIVFLLHRTREASPNPSLNDQHNLLLDRVLGQHGNTATRSISKLLAGICGRAQQPRVSDTLAWMQPTTGQDSFISVRHVVDFAHFVDGGRPIPPSLANSIGQSVFDDPNNRQPTLPTSIPSISANAQASSAQDRAYGPPSDPLAALLAEFDEDEAADSTAQPSPPARRSSITIDDDETERKILAALADSPDLLRYYIRQRAGAQKRPTDGGEETPVKRLRFDTQSDLIQLDSDRGRSKNSFRPTSTQRAIHDHVTAQEYAGKSPTEFIDIAMSSPATKFRPHPAILSRLFDFQFGIRGLSLMHFQRFDLQARREWRRTAKVNMNNFAPSIDLPEPSTGRSIHQLSDALSVLSVYAEEFFDQPTRRLIIEAKEFCEELRSHTRWESSDIDTLCYWFDSVLEDYRRAVNHDINSGLSTRLLVHQKLSMRDPGLQSMLYVIQTERLASLGSSKKPDGIPPRSDSRPDTQRQSRIPKDVIDALPRQGSKSVCLKFLSRTGCSSKSRDRCANPYRAHFIPSSIPLVVKKYIEDHLGGLAIGIGTTQPPPTVINDIPQFQLNQNLQSQLSALIRQENLSLEDTVRLWRGESHSDTRPNAALDSIRLARLLNGYSQRDLLLRTVQLGVMHEFQVASPLTSPGPPPNHKSADVMANALRRSIRTGQDDGTYLVVDLDIALTWGGVQFSPFGCVEKKDVNPEIEARVIHDLSFPRGESTNDFSDRDQLPPLQYKHVSKLARRIDLLRSYPGAIVKLLKGDVKGAFRHIPLSASIVRWFVGHIAGARAAVLDTALPFGWTGSPAHYGVFGSAISWLVGNESPASLDPASSDSEPFFAYEWVDDHVLVEIDRDNRLELCESALRLAMLAVLGPRAINENKFSEWSTKLTVLGLEWDTVDGTVSMPTAKILKAQVRIQAMLASGTASKSALSKLLGSLRHVCSCIRPARPFYQRLVSLWRSAPAHSPIPLSEGARLDLQWFDHVVQEPRLRHLPTSSFCQLPEPDVHLYMDASDQGLCVLHPSAKLYIRVRFDGAEAEEIQVGSRSHFTINVREQLSVIFALLTWSHLWRQQANDRRALHIKCWIDNASAVSWCNRLNSPNPYSQELNRILGVVEANLQVRVSADHLAGSTNFMADLGSRAWQEPQLSQWSNMCRSWTESQVPSPFRKVYNHSSSPFSNAPSPTPRRAPTHPRGASGRASAPHIVSQSGCPATNLNANRYNSFCSLFTAGLDSTLPTAGHPATTPFGPSLATLAGIIVPDSAFHQPSTSAINSPFECIDLASPQQRVLLGAALLGFFFLLRRSEYLEVDGHRHQYCLQVSDVTVLDSVGRETLSYKQSVMVQVRFRGSKTDQDGVGTFRALYKSERPPTCPVFAALLLKRNAKCLGLASTDPICTLTRGKTLTDRMMNSALRACAKGSNKHRVSTHSLRIGGATALFKAGTISDIIKMHGRWRSNAYERYTRYGPQIAKSLAVSMISNQH